MKKHQLLKIGILAVTLVISGNRMSTVSISANNGKTVTEITENRGMKLEKTMTIGDRGDEVQSFEGEELSMSDWNDTLSVYKSKKKVSKNAITMNPYSSKVGYSALSEEEKKVYNELEKASDEFQLSNQDAIKSLDAEGNIRYDENGDIRYIAVVLDLEDSMVLHPVSGSSVGKAVVHFIYDHPEYVWSKGYTYYMASDAMFNSKFAGFTYRPVCRVTLACHKDYADGKKRAKLKKEMYEKIESYMDLIAGISDDYEKELILHDAIAEEITYAYNSQHKPEEARWAHTIEGVFSSEYHSAVCEGYAKAFHLLLNAAGITSNYVVGTSNGEPHAWNQVQLDDEYYNVDLTWDDSGDKKSYRYFNLTTSEFEMNHKPYVNQYGDIPKVGVWNYYIQACDKKDASYTNRGAAKEVPACNVTVSKANGANVLIMNNGIIVASGSTITTKQGKIPLNGIKVSTGTALTIKVIPDYQNDEELQIETILNGEKMYYSGIGGEDFDYTIVVERDVDFGVSIFVPTQGIKINKKSCTIVGYKKKETLIASTIPATATNNKIAWKSSNPSVATVKNGVVTSVAAGTAVIYACADDEIFVEQCKVTVKAPYIKITSGNKTVKVEKKCKMVAKLYGTTGKISWSTSNSKIATVNATTGVVKGKKKGTAWISAKCGKLSTKVKVNVKK